MRHLIPSTIASLHGLQVPQGFPFTGAWQNQVLRMMGIQPNSCATRFASALLTSNIPKSSLPNTVSASELPPLETTRKRPRPQGPSPQPAVRFQRTAVVEPPALIRSGLPELKTPLERGV